MKKTATIIIALFALFISAPAHTAPVYGTTMPEMDRWIYGFETNIIFDRDLENDYGNVSSRQYFADMSYAPYDWLSFDFKIGVGDAANSRTGSDKIVYNPHFAGGYGFRLRLFETPDTGYKGVFGFQHISVHPTSSDIRGSEHEAILDDWQLSLIVSKHIRRFTPYAGIKLSRLDLIHKISGQRKREMADGPYLGLAAGADIKINDIFTLNIEGRVIDEAAFSTSITRRF
ncbi:MAG: hypothetical protein AUJ75_04400 [Candidatus Omnitrophica bacterium CG1_02_49_10]|nr:MAG: hypothetical protein AUJ75_04400 [Candidatus Omnitrophica bacterium CG1_02_49_10]